MNALPKPLFTIIFLGLALRLFLFSGILFNFGEDGLFFGDSKGFFQTAVNIKEGHGFSRDTAPPYAPSAFFPPLYPLLLAGSLAVANSSIPLILLQIALSSVMPVLVWQIARLLTDKKWVWYISAGLMAFEPLGMLWNVTLLTDTISTFFLLLSVLFFIRLLLAPLTGGASVGRHTSRDTAISAISLGLASLTRPEPQYLFLLAVIALLFLALIKKLPLRAVLLFPILFLAIFSPWLVRNVIQFGTPLAATTGVRNIFSSLGTSVITYKTGRPYGEVQDELQQALAQKYGLEEKEITENPAIGPILTAEGFRILRENPKETAITLVITANSFFTQDLYTTYLRQFNIIQKFAMDFSPSVVLIKEGPIELSRKIWNSIGGLFIIPIFGRLLWIVLTIFSICGAVFSVRKHGRERVVGIVLASLILIYAGGSLVAGFSDHGRHRYPVNPFIFILAMYGLIRFSSILQKSMQKI